jgi:phosphoglycerate dehydrogenase-like enzyme
MEERHLARLREVAPSMRITCHPCQGPDDMLPYLAEAEVILSYYASFEMAAAPRLRWAQIANAGVDHLRHEPIWDSEVILTNSHIYATPIAEYVFASMLSFSRRIPQLLAEFGQVRAWPANPWGRYSQQTLELYGSTLGIVGFGQVGQAIAGRGAAFGMRLLATDAKVEAPAERDGVHLLPAEGLRRLLAESDYVVVCVPLTPSTRNLIGAGELSLMKPNAYLVNISRGGVVDEAALIQVLRDGRIAGAGLDVFQNEPLPGDSELFDLPNVILTPHIAGVSPRAGERLADLFAENLRRYVQGEPLLNVVDRRLGF